MSITENPKFQALNPKQIQMSKLKYQKLFRISVISALYLFRVWGFVLSIYHCFTPLCSLSISNLYRLGVGIEPLSLSYLHGGLAQFSHGRLIQGDDIGNLEEVCNT
jgi:hypothetical protein